MNVIRYDQVGTVQIRLLRRPTNTTVGVDNYHFCADGVPGAKGSPVVRFLGVDEEVALRWYNRIVADAQGIAEGITNGNP